MVQVAWLLFSLALGLAGLWFASGQAQARWRAALWAAGLGLFGLLSLFYLVAHHFTAAGIDQSVWFHLQVGLEGAGFGDHAGLMAASVLVLLATLALCLLLYRRLSRPAARPVTSAWHRGRWPLLGLPLALAAWATHPAVRDVVELARLQMNIGNGAQPSEHHRLPQALAWERPRNLVLIYLESLERSFLDERRFPGLTPNLRRLQAQAVDFSDVRQLEGTGWTIAGMVASQCGVPLLTLLHGNDMAGTDRFLSEATCLGDMLKAQGYRMHYMGGASLAFAGKGRFYDSHGFERVEGLTALRERIPDPTRLTSWGLYDDDLLRLASQRHAELAAGGQPFGLVLLTLDTHPPDGHRSPSCGRQVYGDGRNPMLNAVHCSDRLVGEWVDQLRAHPAFSDTVIWIASDHLAMPNAAWKLLEKGARRNLLLALPPDTPPRRVDKPGSTLDTGATILHSLGASEPVMAYGRSLLGDAPTLVQAMEGEVGANAHLAQEVGFLSGLWQHPQLHGGVRLLDDRQVAFGTRTVRFPVLMLVDEQLKVSRVSFGDALPDTLGPLPARQRFVWLDRCERVHGLAVRPNARPPRQPERPYCLAVGAMGSAAWQVFTPVEGEWLSFADMRRAFDVLQDAPEVLARRRTRAESWSRYGSFDFEVYRGKVQGKGRAVIQVAGGVGHAPSARHEDSDVVVPLQRGVTVLGFDEDGRPHKLAYRDTCGDDAGQALQDDAPRLDSLNPTQLRPLAPGGVAVVVQDSGVCGGDSLASLSGVDAFPRLRTLGMREPYVGYVDSDGQVHEYTGPPEAALALRLENFVPNEVR